MIYYLDPRSEGGLVAPVILKERTQMHIQTESLVSIATPLTSPGH